MTTLKLIGFVVDEYDERGKSPTQIEHEVQMRWDVLVARSWNDPPFLVRVRLLFKRWKTAPAPKRWRAYVHTPVTTLNGYPIWRYKELKDKVYFLEPVPGFPGDS